MAGPILRTFTFNLFLVLRVATTVLFGCIVIPHLDVRGVGDIIFFQIKSHGYEIQEELRLRISCMEILHG